MINRHKGQIRVGKSGSVIIGEQIPEKSIISKRSSSRNVEILEESQIRLGLQDREEPDKEPFTLQEEDESTLDEDDPGTLDEDNPGTLDEDDPGTLDEDHKKIDKFDKLVKKNKDSGKNWYHGLKGKWWWGMSEEGARRYMIELESQKELNKELRDSLREKLGENKSQVPRRTIGDIIDNMAAQHKTELPKDIIKRILYIYPLDSTHSFNIVAANHIKYLRHKYIVENKNIDIEEIDWSQLSNINWNEKRNILIHPFLYPFASYESFMQNSRSFAKLLAMKNKIGGFDVADSNKISCIAVDLVNKIDLMMVPSTFAKDAYINSGVTIPVEILPHGIPDEFLGDYPIYTDNIEITRLRRMKQKGDILILFFLVHSGYRKGADLVEKVMGRIQGKFKNVVLVIKGKSHDYFPKIRSVCLESWMSNDDLRLLYDTCDICLSPSRGGGFELNALEAVSRGLPTLVTNGGCFLDLINYFIPVNLSNNITQPLPGNPIHIGLGNEVNIDDFETKLTDVINRLDYWKNCCKNNIKEVRDKYTWRNTAKMLDEHLKNYGFVE